MKFARLLFYALIGGMMFTNCGSSKKTVAENDEVEIQENECRKLARQKPSTRAWGEGTDFDMSAAIEFAELNARTKFARAIETAIESAQDNDGIGYNKGVSNGEEGQYVGQGGTKRNRANSAIAKNVIKGAVIIKDQVFKKKDRQYHAYVTLEYSGDVASMADQITKEMKQQISDEELMKMNFEFNKFREKVKKELDKIKSE